MAAASKLRAVENTEQVGLSIVIPDVANIVARSYTSSSAESAAINSPAVWLQATTDCFVTFGDSPAGPTANNAIRLTADLLYGPFGWVPGWTLKAVSVSSDGTVKIIPGL